MADQTTTAPSEDEVLAAIRSELEAMKVPGGESATPEQRWSDLDVDSLELVELVKALEDRYGITIADEELKPIEGVGDAIALAQRLVGQQQGA
jgi:acyl carrier protein